MIIHSKFYCQKWKILLAQLIMGLGATQQPQIDVAVSLSILNGKQVLCCVNGVYISHPISSYIVRKYSILVMPGATRWRR